MRRSQDVCRFMGFASLVLFVGALFPAFCGLMCSLGSPCAFEASVQKTATVHGICSHCIPKSKKKSKTTCCQLSSKQLQTASALATVIQPDLGFAILEHATLGEIVGHASFPAAVPRPVLRAPPDTAPKPQSTRAPPLV